VYGTVSSVSQTVHPYGSFALRGSTGTGGGGTLRYGGLGRNVQLATPMLLHDRFKPEFGAVTIDAARAHRDMWGTALRRKSTPNGAHQSNRSPGDLKSWSLHAIGPHERDSHTATGAKCTGFNVTSQSRGVVDIFQLAFQYVAAFEEVAAYDPGDADTILPRAPWNHYFLQSSQIRLAASPAMVTDDLEGSLVVDPTSLTISVTRQNISHPVFGAPATVDVLSALEPHYTDFDSWRVAIDAPTWDGSAHGVAQGLVDKLRTRSPVRGRYDMQIDLGGVACTVFRAIPDAQAAALSASTWGYPVGNYDPLGTGPESARVYEVFARDLSAGISQYVPGAGDTIRFQGDKGITQGDVGAGGGYVLRVADGLVVAGGQYVTFYFQDGDVQHTLEDDYEILITGGVQFRLNGVILAGGEGLSGDVGQHNFTFLSDSETTIETRY